MTKSTDKRQLRMLIMGLLESQMEVIPDGIEFFLTDKIAQFVDATIEKNEPALSVRERILAALTEGTRRAQTLDSIEREISKGFGINPTGKAWEDFIEFAYNKSKQGEAIEVFIQWVTSKPNFNLEFWPPVKLQTFWPQAFNVVVRGSGKAL